MTVVTVCAVKIGKIMKNTNQVMTFRQIIELTKEVESRFPNRYGKRQSFMDLVEEVGELSQAMMISEGWKVTNDPAKRRTIEDVKDAVCDVLFEVIRIAEMYEIDLSEEYPKVLAQIAERLDRGEFALKKEKEGGDE